MFYQTFVGQTLMDSKKVKTIYISWTLGPFLRNLNTDLTLRNWSFGSVKLTKNADQDKYKYEYLSCYELLRVHLYILIIKIKIS